MTCILSFVLQVQLEILHEMDKGIFLIVRRFGSDTTSHFCAVTE